MRLVALLLSMLFAAPALAQTQPSAAGAAQPPVTVIVEPAGMLIAAFDADGDARVTRAEFDQGLRHSFDTANLRDGTMGYLAYSDWSERWMGDRNTLPNPFEIDLDGDQRISFSELHQRFSSLFQRLDVDKDGILTRKELVTIRPQSVHVNMDPRNRRRR